MIKKIVKYGAIAVIGLTAVTLAAALLYRKYLQHEVSEARAIRSPNGIDSLEAVRIGGIDQWIEVRGQPRGQTFFTAGDDVSFDLTKLGSNFRVPLFFFEGRIDPYCPGSVIAD